MVRSNFFGSQPSMSDWRRRREEERQRHGLDYINNPDARGKCWVCHYRTINYAPESAREYAIWRRRKIPLVCGRRKCLKRIEDMDITCDYCGRWANFQVINEYDRYLLGRYDVIRCDDCELVSFDDDGPYDTCKMCGRVEEELYVLTDPINNIEYNGLCKRCKPIIMDRFARKYLSFDEI